MIHPLEQRVMQLEKNIRFCHFCFAGLVLVLASFIILSFNNRKSAPDVIEAKAFHVVDERGNTLVELNKEDGNGQISTFTPAGKRLVSLFTTDGGTGGLNTFDKNGQVLFKVTNTTEGGGYMALFNSEGKEVTELGVTDIESGYMKLNNRYGNKLVWMTYTQDGGGYLSLSKEGQEMIRLSTPAIGGRMGIYNNSNTRVIYMGTQDNKDGNVTIWNSAGTRSGGLPQ
ncbi:MAG: hypothetical protein Q8941_16565 [Bacteroidota bacterium]|nr:hypothetical protein [Bacteroidota bacterium]